MNKYIFAECTEDYWPTIKSISATSLNDVTEKLITRYGEELDDDEILNNIENWDQLREYLNDKYNIALSDLEDYDEI